MSIPKYLQNLHDFSGHIFVCDAEHQRTKTFSEIIQEIIIYFGKLQFFIWINFSDTRYNIFNTTIVLFGRQKTGRNQYETG